MTLDSLILKWQAILNSPDKENLHFAFSSTWQILKSNLSQSECIQIKEIAESNDFSNGEKTAQMILVFLKSVRNGIENDPHFGNGYR